jgi:hypothetical protein
LLNLLLPFACGGEVCRRRLLRLLDKGVQQDQVTLSNTEDHTTNAVLRKLAPNLPQTAAKRPTKRHADRPTKLNRGNIITDNAPIVFGQRF